MAAKALRLKRSITIKTLQSHLLVKCVYATELNIAYDYFRNTGGTFHCIPCF